MGDPPPPPRCRGTGARGGPLWAPGGRRRSLVGFGMQLGLPGVVQRSTYHHRHTFSSGAAPIELEPIQLESSLGFWRGSRRNPGLLRRNFAPKSATTLDFGAKTLDLGSKSQRISKGCCTAIQGFCTQKCKNPGFQCKTFESSEISSWTGLKFDRSRLI